MARDDLGGAARLFDDGLCDVGVGPQLGDLLVRRVVFVSVLDCDDVEVGIGRLAGGVIMVENLVAVQPGVCGEVVIDDSTIDASREAAVWAASIALTFTLDWLAMTSAGVDNAEPLPRSFNKPASCNTSRARP
ncbi:hypothetical protein JCM18918_3254 [Cutibacterium acnes JCM 18918]|nr:hypothetical protein JCM18918_3254 [Cutibacterium acnes JCM 18918]